MAKTKRPKDYEVYDLTCEKCGKRIISLSEAQADYNMKAHKLTCKGKEEVKKK